MGASDDIRPDVLAALEGVPSVAHGFRRGHGGPARRARCVEVARGASLAREGEPAEEFGVVVAGKGTRRLPGGPRRQITVETVESGEPLAAVAAIAGVRHPANIEAATPATIACVPTRGAVRPARREPQVARTLVVDLANRVVNFTSVVSPLALDVPGPCARYVFQRALQAGHPSPTGLEVGLGMKKGELAMSLGTVPETLSRAFARLKDDGILEVRGQIVTIFDMRALAALGSGYEEG